MKKLTVISYVLLLWSAVVYSQQGKWEVSGSIHTGSSQGSVIYPGRMLWKGADFEGWNNRVWMLMIGNTNASLVTDVDGNTYRTIRVGDQEWMAENLRVTRYNDYNSIGHIADDTTWSDLASPAWCWYNNDHSDEISYGKLYNWYAVATGKLCPTGWHVPNDTEWTVLTEYLGKITIAGSKAHVGRFTGLPAGTRDEQGKFGNIGSYSVWWSTEPKGNDSAYCRMLSHCGKGILSLTNLKRFGNSVRCLRD
jgi:uncharacterized protein (TIGR02145 family)